MKSLMVSHRVTTFDLFEGASSTGGCSGAAGWSSAGVRYSKGCRVTVRRTVFPSGYSRTHGFGTPSPLQSSSCRSRRIHRSVQMSVFGWAGMTSSFASGGGQYADPCTLTGRRQFAMGRITSSERTGQFQLVFDRLKARAQINHFRSTTPPTWVALAEIQEESYPRDRHRVIVSLAIGSSMFLVICHGSQNSKINFGVSVWRWPGINFIHTSYSSF
jgi:hypothetical protein